MMAKDFWFFLVFHLRIFFVLSTVIEFLHNTHVISNIYSMQILIKVLFLIENPLQTLCIQHSFIGIALRQGFSKFLW